MEKSEPYVLNHDFGYCKDLEFDSLNKLELRNFDDVSIYINQAIRELFFATVDENNLITFLDDQSKVKVNIEKV